MKQVLYGSILSLIVALFSVILPSTLLRCSSGTAQLQLADVSSQWVI